jgi:L-alanine-DL-glutamate epimerase-like enolase superfamily enzyme
LNHVADGRARLGERPGIGVDPDLRALRSALQPDR